MLEGVEDEKEPLATEMCSDLIACTDCSRDRRQNEFRIVERCKVDEPDPVGKLVLKRLRYSQREPRLAAPTRARDRDEVRFRAAQEHRDLLELVVAANEERWWDGQVRVRMRRKRWEVVEPKLVEPLRFGQVLQPMKPEVSDVRIDELARRLREQDLTPVAGRSNTGCPVDVDSHIAVIGHLRLARVEADANTHWSRGNDLCLECRRDRVTGRGERNEKRVALRVHLDP